MMSPMAYKVPDLRYPYDALEPHISAEIMRLHHDKHHQAYVDEANAVIVGTQWEDVRPKVMLTRLHELPDELRDVVRNNCGGQYNHCMLWRSLSPAGGGPPPEGELARAIDDAFGSWEACRDELRRAALGVFGSGWAWLAHDGERLVVCATANQDNPIADGVTPLLGIDVWEHAYYLQYAHRRADYVDAFFEVVDWETVQERYAEAPATGRDQPAVGSGAPSSV
jgi:Fe-Mn family superoxide dismutase